MGLSARGHDESAKAIGAFQLVPGPNATQGPAIILALLMRFPSAINSKICYTPQIIRLQIWPCDRGKVRQYIKPLSTPSNIARG
jgi:hypothetical protein